MIEGYLQRRTTLQCTFLLIDSNIKPQQIDIEFINWLGESRVPFVIVYTKTDKSKPVEVEENIKSFQDALLETWHELPQQFTTSANKRTGRDEIVEYIEDINQKFAAWKQS
jgi:GTP-binding protein